MHAYGGRDSLLCGSGYWRSSELSGKDRGLRFVPLFRRRVASLNYQIMEALEHPL